MVSEVRGVRKSLEVFPKQGIRDQPLDGRGVGSRSIFFEMVHMAVCLLVVGESGRKRRSSSGETRGNCREIRRVGRSGRPWPQDCPFPVFPPSPLHGASALGSRTGNLAGRQWDMDVLFRLFPCPQCSGKWAGGRMRNVWLFWWGGKGKGEERIFSRSHTEAGLRPGTPDHDLSRIESSMLNRLSHTGGQCWAF